MRCTKELQNHERRERYEDPGADVYRDRHFYGGRSDPGGGKDQMEKKKVRRMIRCAVERMKGCLATENPTPEEREHAYMLWEMWIDCLHDRKLILASDQLLMRMELEEFKNAPK